MSRAWTMLLYKIPREPTSRRVYVWRKLKQLGAVHLHDAAWCLPATDWTREQFMWLAVEIQEFGGMSTVFEAKEGIPGQDEVLVRQFLDQVDTEYSELLERLEKSDSSLEDLAKRYQQIRNKDYFDSRLGQRVRERLTAKRGRPS